MHVFCAKRHSKPDSADCCAGSDFCALVWLGFVRERGWGDVFFTESEGKGTDDLFIVLVPHDFAYGLRLEIVKSRGADLVERRDKSRRFVHSAIADMVNFTGSGPILHQIRVFQI